MKKNFLFSCFIIMAVFGYSQELLNSNVNEVDGQGRRQGEWKSYDVDGNLKFEGHFVDNIPVGTFTYYYPNGKVKAISEMHDMGRRSRTKVFHDNGRLMGEGNYLDKVKDSTWNYYSDFDGLHLSREYYINGKLDSTVLNFYPNGKVAEEIPYELGRKEGVWKQYFTDGKLKLKATYINDRLEGLMLIYHLNGVPEVSGMYKNNFKNGLWIYFNEKGVVNKKETFVRGHLRKTEEGGQ
ncbi:MAG: toxin-antitoxin system YwqK family antitoxin [Bacteroidota bacterium]